MTARSSSAHCSLASTVAQTLFSSPSTCVVSIRRSIKGEGGRKLGESGSPAYFFSIRAFCAPSVSQYKRSEYEMGRVSEPKESCVLTFGSIVSVIFDFMMVVALRGEW